MRLGTLALCVKRKCGGGGGRCELCGRACLCLNFIVKDAPRERAKPRCLD